VLEKESKTIAAIALAMLAIASSALLASTPAYSERLDSFGVKEVYPTALGGNEWHVNMDDPRSDPNFRNLGNVHFNKNADGSWQVSADQIRMEAWSPEGEKWRNVEMTMYAKMESGSNELLQMYSRGGHHTNRDQCLGSAYKARLYGDGLAAWNKEITHPAYAGNRGSAQATDTSLEDRWIGFKAVIYNFVEDGNTYVRLESYIDDDVTDSSGNLEVKNNWKLASVYEDRGGWATNNSDFNSSCGRDRDEILTKPGGTDSQNIAAFRSDDLTWSFKYLSVREIHASIENASEAPQESEEPSEPSTPGIPPAYDDISADTLCCTLVTIQHMDNSAGTDTIDSVNLSMKKSSSRSTGIVTVAIVEGDDVIAIDTISTRELETTYTTVRAEFSPSVQPQGGFDIVVKYEGSGVIGVNSVAVVG